MKTMIENWVASIQSLRSIALRAFQAPRCRAVNSDSSTECRSRKSNLSQSSNNARAMEAARLNEKFSQAELRSLEQVEREAPHRAAEIQAQSQA
ncbi:hypothetical protein TNCV_205931 [Trichonephila clavipes]|nr:hypothetical protein TNCV_205931 [Trichonephila clavipes]